MHRMHAKHNYEQMLPPTQFNELISFYHKLFWSI